MNKRREMLITDAYLANTIFMFTKDLDKAYEIFVALHNQEFWKIDDIERRL